MASPSGYGTQRRIIARTREAPPPNGNHFETAMVRFFGWNLDWLTIFWGLLAIAVGIALSTAVLVIVFVALPADYLHSPRATSPWEKRHALLRWIVRLAKNLAAIILIGLGVLLSIPGIPGQGLLTILVGIILLDFPGKVRIEKQLVTRPAVLRSINRLRARFGRPPLMPCNNHH
jgi:hypothetical protein